MSEVKGLIWIAPQRHIPLQVEREGVVFVHEPTKCAFVSDGQEWVMLTSSVSVESGHELTSKMPEELNAEESRIFLDEITLMGVRIYAASKTPALLFMDKGKILAEYVRLASGGLVRSWPTRKGRHA